MKTTLSRIACLLSLLMVAHPAQAFNSTTHEQVTRSFLHFLRSHATVFPETARWLGDLRENEALMQETLTRAVIDADYQTDLWLSGSFHDPFTGAHTSGGFTFFTSMYHFLNVTVPGDFWEFDGYAYRHGSGRNNDAYLATPSATVVGSRSVPLGGSRTLASSVIPAAAYSQGFLGDADDWHALFFGAPATRAVFPPANVPAQLAFDAVMRSPRAAVNRAESWSARVPLVTGLFSSELWDRQYSRAEIAGLPKDFDRLGLVLHLAQDLAVPQHAEGTADYCHHELEQLIDRLACKSGANIDPLPYNRGTYSANEYPDCQNLYDEKLVAKILSEQPFLNPLSDLKVSGRLTELAKVSARWQWGDPSDSVDMLGTMLPDGMEITGDTCEQILRDPAIEPQIRFQYNLGVAVSASIFELAAHRYKSPQLLE